MPTRGRNKTSAEKPNSEIWNKFPLKKLKLWKSEMEHLGLRRAKSENIEIRLLKELPTKFCKENQTNLQTSAIPKRNSAARKTTILLETQGNIGEKLGQKIKLSEVR